MSTTSLSHKQIIEAIRQSDTRKVKVAIADIDGVLRGKYIHKDKFFSAVDGGFGFCDVIFGWDCGDACYDNSKFTGWHSGYPDATARIDLATFRKIPWDNGTAFFLGDFVDSKGDPLAICPRQNLKKVIAEAQKDGFAASFGLEFEWFNFKETPQTLAEKNYDKDRFQPLTPGMFGYSVLRSTLNQPFFSALMEEMRDFGVPIEGLHTETGPGVYEAAILYSDALEAADRATLFKTGAKEIAYRFGIVPSFMARWNNGLPGCSGHMHQSLWNASGDKNLFYDERDPRRMSPLFKSYLAGQLKLMPELLPFYAPTVNSYKRLVEGYWAPTKANWSVDNRTVALRVIPASAKSTRLETRVSGSDINPYLSVAAALASGLYGIRKGLKLEAEPIQGSGYADTKSERLPSNLYEAALRLQESKAAREIFGDAFVDHYAASRIWEWRQYQQSVTSWETRRYFEII